MTAMDADMLVAFMAEHFPQAQAIGARIDHVDAASLHLRLPTNEQHLRPGGTVSGPTMMQLADMAMYLMILSRIGPVALAVTTNLNINFLRKPEMTDLIARASLLKLGKRLAVGEVGLYSDGTAEPVAHATLTYSIPAPAK